MPLRIGVLATRLIWVGMVEENRILNPVRIYPEPGEASLPLVRLPAEELVARIREQVMAAAEDRPIEAVGLGFPGIIRNGVVEDAPNLQQIKGFPLQRAVAAALAAHGMAVTVRVLNDADAIAAGIAATR